MVLPATAELADDGHGDSPLRPRPGRREHAALALAVGSAFVSGLVCAVLLYWVEDLGNTQTWYEIWHGVLPWGIVTIVVGFAVRAPDRVAAAAGMAAQIGLVVGYYVTTYVDYHVWDPGRFAVYGIVALVVGPLYGVAGAWLRDPAKRHRPLVAGLLSAPWLIDAITLLSEEYDEIGHDHDVPMIAVGLSYVATGVALLVGLSRSRPDGVRAAALAIALIAVSHLSSISFAAY